MQKPALISIMMLSFSTLACGQGKWNKSIIEHDLYNGTLLSIEYNTPLDSSKISIALVSLDSLLCYSGYRVVDRFPPEADFNIETKWKRCRDDQSIVFDLNIEYRGSDKLILYSDTQYHAESGYSFIVKIRDSGNISISQLKNEQDLENLPSDTAAKLRTIIQGLSDRI
jgi:hypothetical protein